MEYCAPTFATLYGHYEPPLLRDRRPLRPRAQNDVNINMMYSISTLNTNTKINTNININNINISTPTTYMLSLHINMIP